VSRIERKAIRCSGESGPACSGPSVAGRALGRRVVKVDLARAERLRTDGLGLRAIAAKLGISVNTLQRARGRG
jgi:hypothetical protein